MTKIKIACPAGSGMNFAQNLLQLSFYDTKNEFTTGGHERKYILEEVPTLVILRNPYQSVASAAERWISDYDHVSLRGHESLIKNLNTADIVKQIISESTWYKEFFKNIEDLKHVKIFTFDMLTKEPDIFVKKVSEHFSIDSKIAQLSIEDVFKAVADSGNKNRIPRTKTEGRSKVDELIRIIFPEKEFECLSIYLYLKEKIESGLL